MNASSSAALEVRGLNKSFGANRVLQGIDLKIGGGEFVGLMGPNGAGKSTLIKILDGLEAADDGEIRFEGSPVASLAGHPGLAFIHQDMGLVGALSIADNLRLGQAKVGRRWGLLNHRRERELAVAAVSRVGLDRDVGTLVEDLAPGEMALVAVARALDRGARLLIIDEVSSTLASQDARRLFAALKEVVAAGGTVVMVSHRLHEILDTTDRVVVLLDGSIVADQSSEALDRDGLVRLLFQREAAGHDPTTGFPDDPGDAVLALDGAGGGRCLPVDLVLREGEAVGVTGLPGSGLHDLAAIAAGVLPPRSGQVRGVPPNDRAFVPPHRETQGGFDELTVLHNLTLSSLSRWRPPWLLLRAQTERKEGIAMLARLAVRPLDPDGLYGALSGGNKQKVIFGRTLLRGAKVYILCEPTRGVDVQTRAELYALIRELVGARRAVLIVTSDPEDLFAVCDRIGTIRAGRLGQLAPRIGLQLSDIEELV